MASLLFATPDGRVRIDSQREAVGRSGSRIGPAERLIPLPDGAALMHLPGRRPLGVDREGRLSSPADGVAVAAVLPPGYLRTDLPAYEDMGTPPVLPLYGYTMVAAINGDPAVAALRTDAWAAWDPSAPARGRMPEVIRQAMSSLPGNPLVPHLARCATEYRCLTAQNLFLRRGEGAIPVSPACNAACLGCISEQWGEVDSPQERLTFAPGAAQIAELAAWHLSGSAHNFVSFGQGCEGEPLTRGSALVEATRRIRAAFPRATIHINTNGSRPRTLARLIEAGLNSARISIFSLHDERFRAYYRPIGYGLRDIEACAALLGEAGAQLTVNLLTFPGVSDLLDEVEALVGFVDRFGVHQVQLRTLNVDPLWLLRRLPPLPPGIGMRTFTRTLAERCPRLKLGNFTRAWRVPAAPVLA